VFLHLEFFFSPAKEAENHDLEKTYKVGARTRVITEVIIPKKMAENKWVLFGLFHPTYRGL